MLAERLDDVVLVGEALLAEQALHDAGTLLGRDQLVAEQDVELAPVARFVRRRQPEALRLDLGGETRRPRLVASAIAVQDEDLVAHFFAPSKYGFSPDA